jgi:spermidine synthase
MFSYTEKFNDALTISRSYDQIESFQTPYQKIDLIKNSTIPGFECAFIDGELQLSMEDEYFYHESLVHPAMFAHENPKDILIMGGGDGMALREVLKHPIASVTLIDLDEQFVNWCKNNKSHWGNKSFLNPKVKLIFGDALKEIKKFNKQFDVIICDLVTLLDKELFGDNLPYSTTELYNKKFFQNCSDALKNSSGIFTTQSHNLGLSDNSYKRHTWINDQLKSVFSITNSYAAYVESFCSTTSFISSSDTVDVSKLKQKRIQDIETMTNLFKVYEYDFHKSLFYLNKIQKELLKKGYI